MAWGAVLACTAACKSFVGLVVVRTLLGIFECVCQPAFVFLSVLSGPCHAMVIHAFTGQQCGTHEKNKHLSSAPFTL